MAGSEWRASGRFLGTQARIELLPLRLPSVTGGIMPGFAKLGHGVADSSYNCTLKGPVFPCASRYAIVTRPRGQTVNSVGARVRG